MIHTISEEIANPSAVAALQPQADHSPLLLSFAARA
jgi:hypothetical protein